MNENIQKYVDDFFKDVPNKRRVMEIREELLSDMCEKYEDLVNQGKNEDEAYSTVVSGIGDIAGLIDDVIEVEKQSFTDTAIRNKCRFIKKKYNKEDNSFAEEYREKISLSDKTSRLHSALSSSLWTLTLLVYFLISFFTNSWDISWVVFLMAVVLQQCITSIINKKINSGGIVWTSAVVVYFLLSFTTERWDYTWLIFFAAAVIQQAIRLYNIWREQ